MKKFTLPKTFNIPIPKFTYKQTGSDALLVLAIVIFSFLLGMLTNKVIYLQHQLDLPAPTPAANQQALGPTPPPVVKDMKAGHLPVLGNKDAKVTVVEFSDFQCPFCEEYFTKINTQVDKEYIKTGKIKFAYRQFPLNTIHPNAQKAAEASECANAQNKFWEYHDILFKNQNTWAPKTADDAAGDFTDFAGQIGLDTNQFSSCLTNDEGKKNVDDDIAVATDVQVDATPTFFVNGVRVVGAVPFDQLKQTIDAELKK